MSEDAMVTGRRCGRYWAVCGAVVLAASLTAPAQTYCRSCGQGGGAVISEVTEWLALHRAHEGAVTKVNGEYLSAGRPVVEFLVAALDELLARGLLALERPDPLGFARVCITHTGQARYGVLRDIAVRTGMGAARLE